mgnify:CR=1 FL=1
MIDSCRLLICLELLFNLGRSLLAIRREQLLVRRNTVASSALHRCCVFIVELCEGMS